ncbi:MAG: hypothetical protein QXP77_01875 [Candidatus Aenigmatarchaeota archaeon]
MHELLNENFKILSSIYEIEINKTKDELIESLYKISENLHPKFLFTTGSFGTLNDLNWLIKHKEDFKKFDKNAEFMDRLQKLSENFSEIIFGEYFNEAFEGEVLYLISSSSFKRMGVNSSVKNKELELDLPVGKVDYRFVPWTSGIEKEVGKVLDEYYLDDNLKVEIGLKPSIFRYISNVTIPIHEVIHHISSLYNPGAYESAIYKSFKESFDEPKFNLSLHNGILFGSIDENLKRKLKEKRIDISGRDILDPFIFWEIVKRYGNQISSISGIPIQKLENSSLNYLSKILPFRILEEGLACYFSIENADIENPPLKFSGLENSLREIVKFGSKLKKLEYLERGISFYTKEKIFLPYLIPELQLYPFSYIYCSENFKGKNLKDCLDILRKNYMKNNIQFHPRSIRRKEIEREKIDVLIEEINSTLKDYRKRIGEIDNILNEYKNKIKRTSIERNLDSLYFGNDKEFLYLVLGSIFAYTLAKSLDSIF